MGACTLSLGRGGYFFEDRKKRSPSNTNANMINPSVFFIALSYHISGIIRRCERSDRNMTDSRKRMRENQVVCAALHAFPLTLTVFPNPFSGYYRNASVLSAAIRACRHIVSLAEMLVDELGHFEHRDLVFPLKNRL